MEPGCPLHKYRIEVYNDFQDLLYLGHVHVLLIGPSPDGES